MKQTRSAHILFGTSTAALCLSVLLMASNAHSETYIGGQFGTTIAGNTLSNVDLTDFSPNASMSDRSLATSPLIGFKFGYYFPQARWFGLETEAYYMTPHIKQQPTTVTIPPPGQTIGGTTFKSGTTTSSFTGDHFRVLTWMPVNLMFRYYKTRLQPYFGFGPGVFMAQVKTTETGFEGTQNSTKLGLNAKLGGEYFFTKHLTVFTELKYNYTSFDFASKDTSFGFKATYSPILLAFGVSYHF